MAKYKDSYFHYDSYRDSEGKYAYTHITLIGVMEKEGLALKRSVEGNDGEEKMYAFGRITVFGYEKNITMFLTNLHGAFYFQGYDPRRHTPATLISFTAGGAKVEDAYALEEGDVVLMEGTAYRKKGTRERDGESYPEISLTVNSLAVLYRQSTYHPRKTDLVPQQ